MIALIFFIAGCRYDGARESIKSTEFEGVITNTFKEFSHNANVFRINAQNTSFEFSPDLWPDIWKYAEIGDSIIKPKDTLMIIIKKNDSISREFFYEF